MADTTGSRWDQIKAIFRLGAGAKGQSCDGTFTLGNIPKYKGDGTTMDSGVAASSIVTSSSGAISESQVTNLVTDLAAKVPATRLINTTAPLTGGGNLSADRTLGISIATTSANGVSRPDGITIGINAAGQTSVIGGSGASISAIQQESYTYAGDSGTANAYAVTLSPAPTIVAGSEVVFKSAHANTGASTLSVNGGTASPITKNGTTTLASGDIATGEIITVKHDGTRWQIVGRIPSLTGLPTGAGVIYNGTQTPAGNVAATPLVVQSKASILAGSLAFTSNVTTGNLLVALVGDETSAVANATISDSLGCSWSSAISVTGSTNQKLFYTTAIASGPCTVTFAGFSSAGWESVALLEASGVQAVLDGTPAGAVGGNSPGSITTSAANSLLIVGLVGFHSATNWTAPSGWSITQAATHDAVGIAFHVQATPGTVAPTFTGTSIDSNAQVIVGFRAGTSSAFAGGSNDDYYFQTNTHALYGPKIGGAWPTSPIPFASFVAAVPATSSSSGTPGSMAYDSSGNLYWCYATNAWARVGPAGYSSSF